MIVRRSPQSLPAIILVAVILRLVLFAFTPIPSLLASRPELSTPITSFRSRKSGPWVHGTIQKLTTIVREGVFLLRQGINPYGGGVFHHSPLYLALFGHVLPVSSASTTCIIWTVIDIVGALALVATSRLLSGGGKATSRESLVALAYLFNPYTLMTCLARSTTALDSAVLLLTFYAASAGLDHVACVSLAIASHTSLYPVLLLPAMLMSLVKTAADAPFERAATGFLTFAVVAGLLGWINSLMLGTIWVDKTWGTILGVSDLTPNSGMWWYFFTEMFDHFRPFFVGVFHLQNVIYVVPICLRLRREPVLAMAITTGVFCTWKSYPTVGDLGLWAGLVSCHSEVTRDLRHPLFTVTVYLYTLILLPLLHSLWLLTGTGNANFFYAATMVHGLNSSLVIVDVLGASIRRQVRQSLGAKWDGDRWQVVQLNKVE